MIEAIKADLECSLKGKMLWENLEAKYKVDNEWLVIIFHPEYKLINNYVIKSLPDYLKRKYINHVLAVSSEKYCMNEISGTIIIQEQIELTKMEELLKYYRLVQFSKNIVVTALEEPYGNWGIIGKANITLEDYVENAILV